MQIKKIDKAIWEMEKEGQMRVPAHIFANERIIEGVKKDKTLQQLQNVAGLPGIVKHALLMPDGHEGYGFPIGGVAAFDAKDGVVSPGGVGYDINCTDGETKVLLQHGVYLKIKELEEMVNEQKTKFVDFNEHSVKNVDILYFMKREERSHIYEIKTKSGLRLRVTGDHPIYTKNGMKKAETIGLNDVVAIYSFSGVQYVKPPEEIILGTENIEEVLEALRSKKQLLKGNSAQRSVRQILNNLKKRGLLPLRYSSPQTPYLAKILGYVFGNGSISLIKKKENKEGVVWFYGNEEDLERIREDIKKIGFTPSRIYKRLKEHKISTHHKDYKFAHIEIEHSFKVSSSSFASLLIALGAPVGLKTTQAYLVPKWLMKAPLWIKRLFLAAFFGAEMSPPATSDRYNFYPPTFGINKLEGLEVNAVEFLTQIKELLGEFGIETTPIMKVEHCKINEEQNTTCNYRIQVLTRPKNLVRFFRKVSFEYNIKKFRDACLAVNYIRLKQKSKILNKAKNKAVEPYADENESYANRKSPREICAMLSTKHAFEQDLLSFSEYKEKYAIGSAGLAWDEIDEIKKVPFNDWVYDITINDENHNFIANNFVVSNCGVRLLTTPLTEKDVRPKIRQLCDTVFKDVPSGVGSEGRIKLSHEELDEAAVMGVDWAIEKGYGTKEDKEHCEEYGRMEGADPNKVTPTAKKRGKSQFGTLGAGNHFLEIQVVEKVFKPDVAKAFGLEEGKVTVMVHCGSRGYGHQICSDSIPPILNLARKRGLWLPDPELAYAPLESKEAQDYLAAMRCAVNYAFTNRHIIAHWTRESFDKVFGKGTSDEMKLIYDVAHNIAKFEEHVVDGKKQNLIVHRKGATRAFPKGRPELPRAYREIGQPVLIPGSMGTASYVLVGNPKGLDAAFGTTCHGAGRTMSRGEAIRTHRGDMVAKDLWDKNKIYVRATEPKVIAEEAPDAYKNIDDVVQSVQDAGISDIVARLRPLGVVKG